MPGIISENYVSRKFTDGIQGSSFELIYDVINTDDDGEVRTLLLGTAPATYAGLILDSVEGETQGGGVWRGSAKYIRPENQNEYTFDTSGGTQHITQSIQTMATYAPSGLSAPDFQGAIGVSEDRVDGVDVQAPKFDFSETHIFDNSLVSAGYKRVLFLLTGCFNADSFKGFDAGECLFLGASGTQRGFSQWSITFRFSGSPNVTGLTIGDITDINKLGWDYLWVRYGDFEDTSARALVKRPTAAYVERVLKPADFSTLLIGT